MCILIFSASFIRHSSSFKKKAARYCRKCEKSSFLSNFNETLIFSTDFRKSLKYQISSKSVQWKSEGRTGGQADRNDESKVFFVFFLQFCERA